LDKEYQLEKKSTNLVPCGQESEAEELATIQVLKILSRLENRHKERRKIYFDT